MKLRKNLNSTKKILLDKNLILSERVVLMFLKEFSKDGQITISMSEIAECLSITKPTVNAAIRSLVEKGYLSKIKKMKEDGSLDVNTYKILKPAH